MNNRTQLRIYLSGSTLDKLERLKSELGMNLSDTIETIINDYATGSDYNDTLFNNTK